MLLGWKNQYGENDCTTKNNLEIKSNIKLPMAFFTYLEQKNSKIIWRHRRPQIAKVILRKKNRSGGINSSDLRLYYKAIVIQRSWHWHKNRSIDQWNKIYKAER